MVVLFLSGHGDTPTVSDSYENGAYGWLEKTSPATKIQAKVVAAMKEAEARTLHLHQRIPVLERWSKLTPREKEAARHIRKGWASRLIADEMKINARTADGYRAVVFETLWVNNPTELDRLMRDYDIE
jgi:FixJ family two-component response regulator